MNPDGLFHTAGSPVKRVLATRLAIESEVMSVTRRRFLSALPALPILVRGKPGGSFPARAQTPPVAPRFEALRGGVGFFTARGGTIGYLLSPDGVVVVDTQYPDTAPACLAGLRERTSRPIDLVINTHHHADHTGGNAVFRAAAGQIVAHARVPELQRMAAAQAPGGPPVVVADVTFADTWAQPFGGETVSARHYGPAHTGGDIVGTFARANVVHLGDLVFNRVHPRVDRPAGASIANWVAALERIVGDHDADTRYIFGHAKPEAPVTGGRADVLLFRDYLAAALEYVRRAVAAGKSRDEIVRVDAVPGFADFAPLGGRLTASHVLEMAFEELQGRSGGADADRTDAEEPGDERWV